MNDIEECATMSSLSVWIILLLLGAIMNYHEIDNCKKSEQCSEQAKIAQHGGGY